MIVPLLAQAVDGAAIAEALRHAADGRPLPTKPEGVGMGSVPGWIMTILTGGILGALLRFGLSWRRQSMDRDGVLNEERRGDMKGMRERIDTLERQLGDTRARHDQAMRELARDRETERLRHEAEMRVMRHRLGNSNQCFDALLMLLETSPEKVSQALTAVKEMRARQREAEAIEMAGLVGEKASVDGEHA